MDFIDSVKSEADNRYIDMLYNKCAPLFSSQADVISYMNFKTSNNEYHARLENEKRWYNDSLGKIIRQRDNRLIREKEAERLKNEKISNQRFVRNEAIKTFFVNLPALILIIFGIVLLLNPTPILKNINIGWIIGPYVAAFCISFIIAITILVKAKRGKAYKYVKQRCAIMIAGAVVFLSLMSVGVGLGQERVKNDLYNEFCTRYKNVINSIEDGTYYCEFSDAKTLNTFIIEANEQGLSGTIKFTMANNFVASDGLQIVDGIVTGIGNCTDKYIFFDKPIKDYAFDGSSQPRRIFFLEGCESIGQRAFRSCGNLTRAYFMQSQVPKIGGGLFSYTWNDSSFKIVVPENLLSAYKRVNADYWYELYNSQFTTIQFPISINF